MNLMDACFNFYIQLLNKLKMKEYFLLLRGGRSAENTTPEERMAEMAKWGPFMGKFGQQITGGLPFQSGGNVVSENGISNLPVDGANGIAGGWLVVKAESMDEATAIANECPHIAYGGNIEVREIAPMPAM